MIQLRILTGKQAGCETSVRRFPFVIGRAAEAGLRVEEPGVWNRHVEIQLNVSEGFRLQVHGEALASVNGEPVREALISNGDTIDLGSLRIQFWLARARQKGWRMREWASWLSILSLFAGQIALIYLALP